MDDPVRNHFRLGVLVPAGNPTVEPELYRMAPTGLSIHFARLETLAGEPGAADGMERRTLGYLDAVPAAIRSLAPVRPAAIALAHTAVSYLTGLGAETARLDEMTAGSATPLFTAARAIRAALSHLGVRRLALATPYPAVISAAARVYWEAAGLEVVNHRRVDLANIYEATEERAHALGREADCPAADAVLISGTGLPTRGIIEALEHELGKPVVTSQAATLWHALRTMGIASPVVGYGRLLASVADPGSAT